MNVPATKAPGGEIIEAVIAKGDLTKLTAEERTKYYTALCQSMNLNPFTKPFEYVSLGGRLVLYPTKTCADQLRMNNDITIEIVSRELDDGVLTVHVRAKTPTGRMDEDYGCVPLADTLKGEARANAEMKAITKAKRRVTLSICGLGWGDDDIEDLTRHSRKPLPPAPDSMGYSQALATGSNAPATENSPGEGFGDQHAPVSAPNPTIDGADDTAPYEDSDALVIQSLRRRLNDLAEEGDVARLESMWKEAPRFAQEAFSKEERNEIRTRCNQVAADLLARK